MRRTGPKLAPIKADTAPLWQRLGWLAAIWLGSVAALGVVAWLLRAWLLP